MNQLYIYMYLGFIFGLVVKESPYNEGDLGSIHGLGRYAQRDISSLSRILSWRISWTESLAGYSPYGHKEYGTSESTEFAQAHIHISIPLQILSSFMLLQYF